MITRNLEDFGRREKELAIDLLKAMCEATCGFNLGLPDDFEDQGVAIEFDSYTDDVYLTNAFDQIVKLNEDGELVLITEDNE